MSAGFVHLNNNQGPAGHPVGPGHHHGGPGFPHHEGMPPGMQGAHQMPPHDGFLHSNQQQFQPQPHQQFQHQQQHMGMPASQFPAVGQEHAPHNFPQQGPQISDITRATMTEDDAFDKLITYVVVRLVKPETSNEHDKQGYPLPASWKKAIRSFPSGYTKHDAVRRIDELDATTHSLLKKKQDLPEDIQLQLDSAQKYLQYYDPNNQYVYVLKQLEFKTSKASPYPSDSSRYYEKHSSSHKSSARKPKMITWHDEKKSSSKKHHHHHHSRSSSKDRSRSKHHNASKGGKSKSSRHVEVHKPTFGKHDNISVVTAYFQRTPIPEADCLRLLDEEDRANKLPQSSDWHNSQPFMVAQGRHGGQSYYAPTASGFSDRSWSPRTSQSELPPHHPHGPGGHGPGVSPERRPQPQSRPQHHDQHGRQPMMGFPPQGQGPQNPSAGDQDGHRSPQPGGHRAPSAGGRPPSAGGRPPSAGGRAPPAGAGGRHVSPHRDGPPCNMPRPPMGGDHRPHGNPHQHMGENARGVSPHPQGKKGAGAQAQQSMPPRNGGNVNAGPQPPPPPPAPGHFSDPRMSGHIGNPHAAGPGGNLNLKHPQPIPISPVSSSQPSIFDESQSDGESSTSSFGDDFGGPIRGQKPRSVHPQKNRPEYFGVREHQKSRLPPLDDHKTHREFPPNPAAMGGNIHGEAPSLRRRETAPNERPRVVHPRRVDAEEAQRAIHEFRKREAIESMLGDFHLGDGYDSRRERKHDDDHERRRDRPYGRDEPRDRDWDHPDTLGRGSRYPDDFVRGRSLKERLSPRRSDRHDGGDHRDGHHSFAREHPFTPRENRGNWSPEPRGADYRRVSYSPGRNDRRYTLRPDRRDLDY